MPADSVSRSDSNGSNNDANVLENLFSTSPGASSLSRERTDSESSDKVTRFVLPSMDGSPPKVVTMDELSSVFKNIKNMELAHEIALNPDFKLQPYEPPANSLEGRIKSMMHKAFWDSLREQLNKTPPSFDHAIQLLGDIKECFPQILSRHNVRALEHINEVLDDVVIRQQAEKGVLDFKGYANFVIQIMAKSCAPARDEAVQKLTEIEDVVDMFRGILETMTLMKLDMANYLLDHARNDIMANSVEYEKEKFKEYLEYYKFGFPATENWLKQSRTMDANNVPSTSDQTIANAYMQLINWDANKEFPEILSIDKERILKLGQRVRRLCASASLVAICMAIPIVSQRGENRIALAKQIDILLKNVTNENELTEAVNNVWEQIKSVINGYLEKENEAIMDTSTENLLKEQIMKISAVESPVRLLMYKRLQTYVRLVLRSKSLPPPPPGYTDYKEELESITSAFKRIIAYNHSVFGDYFMQVLTQQRPTTDSNETTTAVTNTTMNEMPQTSTEAANMQNSMEEANK